MKRIEEHPIQTGGNIAEIVGKLAYDSTKKCFEELVSNAYDADAEKVTITVYKDKAIIEDDGLGMDSKGLEDYLRIGGSVKWDDQKKAKTTPKFNREPIGRFGLGKFSLYMLCDSYTIETCKNGEKRTFDFDYNELGKHQNLDDYVVRANVESCPTEWHGTKVIMNGLKKNINVNEICNMLGRTMPTDPTFSMYMEAKIGKYKNMNGKIVPRQLAKGETWRFRDTLRGAGEIDGYITLTNAPLKEGQDGVYVRVRGRVRGDKNTIDLDKVRGTTLMKRRLYGEFNADFLRDLVKIDSGGFYRDDLRFKKAEDYIMVCVKEVVKIYEQRKREQRNKDLTDVVKDVVMDLKNAFGYSERLKDIFADIRRRKKENDYQQHEQSELAQMANELADKLGGTREQLKDKKPRQQRNGNIDSEARKKKKEEEEIKKKQLPADEFMMGGVRFKLGFKGFGHEGYPCYIEANGNGRKEIMLNSEHPSLEFAEKTGKGAVSMYIRNAVCLESARFCIAQEEGRFSPDELMELYNESLRRSANVKNGDENE